MTSLDWLVAGALSSIGMEDFACHEAGSLKVEECAHHVADFAQVPRRNGARKVS